MEQVRLFQDTNAIESLRNSDFDAVSAYGEVVDNSIEAKSNHIRIQFTCKSDSNNYIGIERVAFGDDGIGMNEDSLNRCLQIGWSSRFNSRSGIGRFGVGMTLAAIHECRRVEVYSKTKEGKDWLWTYVDLDENKSGSQESIPIPKPRNIPQELEVLIGKESGTLVVWSKYDRQERNARNLIKDAKEWMGRTYRYFIWEDNIKISIDGEEIKAIDPLYYQTKNTRFTDDPQSELFEPIEFSWPVESSDAPKNAPKESMIRIHMSKLHESFRPREGSGGAKLARDRFIHHNEGISILRNRREVFYGHIPYWRSSGSKWSRFEEIDRWWGCEIHFDPVLDRAFTVKNIKRGAIPKSNLKKLIKEHIAPTRNTVLQVVRDKWDKVKVEEQNVQEGKEKKNPLNQPPEHIKAQKIVKDTTTEPGALDKDKDFDSEADDFIEKNLQGFSEEKKAEIKALLKSQPFTVREDAWKGPKFFETSFLGGSSVLTYNLSHLFFKEVYGVIENLNEEEVDHVESARTLKTLIDLLIIAYARAQIRFDPDINMPVEDIIERTDAFWGDYLQSYMNTWKKGTSNETD